jgi:microcystin degradation protein MlrC
MRKQDPTPQSGDDLPTAPKLSPLRGTRRTLMAGVAALLALAPVAAAQPKPPSAGVKSPGKPLKFAVFTFTHETTSFNSTPTTLEMFPPASTLDQIADANDAAKAFIYAMEDYNNVTVVPLESVYGAIGGSSGSSITNAAFEHIASKMIADLKAKMPVNGVFLPLHGAAEVTGVRDPESEIARRVREVVGPDVPIIGEFDLHGNQDDFLKYANASFAVKYFPHYDHAVQGERAARLMVRMAEGRYKSTTAVRRPGIVLPTVYLWTGAPPFNDIMQRALVWEARKPDVYVSVFLGYPWSDVENAGMTVEVMTNNDPKLAEQIAQDMSDYMWRRRKEMLNIQFVKPDQLAPAVAKLTSEQNTPIVIADYSDRAGDATYVLEQVVKHDMSGVVLATIRDERVIDRLTKRNAKPGQPFDELVGGFAERSSGPPVRVKGTLRYFGKAEDRSGGDNETVAMIEFGKSNYLIITPTLRQVVDPNEVTSTGIDKTKVTSWALKSRGHFRRGFHESGFAKGYLFIDPPEPFVGTIHLEALPYKHLDLKKNWPWNGK